MSASKALKLLTCKRGVATLEFVFLAPALLTLIFGIMVYSIYFAASVGVRQAASDGARAAVAGLYPQERTNIATQGATAVIEKYRSVLGTTANPVITTVAGTGTALGTFTVTVSYDMTNTPIMRYINFIPMPSKIITASVTVTNGGY